jgi:hypothetical protein
VEDSFKINYRKEKERERERETERKREREREREKEWERERERVRGGTHLSPPNWTSSETDSAVAEQRRWWKECGI